MKETLTFFGDLAFSDRRVEFETFLGDSAHCNLEAPIVKIEDDVRKSLKVGPHLAQSGNMLKQEEFAKFSYSLSNNHIMDYGPRGLFLSKERLGANQSSGASSNLTLARLPLETAVEGHPITIISASDNFFGAAGNSEAGIAVGVHSDDWVADMIVQARESGATPIVSFHGGFEDFMVPAPPLRDKFHHWINSGAEAVICHHSHLPLPWENYRGKKIYFGLGNFLVNPSQWMKTHQYALTSIAVDVSFCNGEIELKHRFINLSEHKSHDGRLIVADSPQSTADRLNSHFEKIQTLVTQPDEYSEVVENYAISFFLKHARYRMFLGAAGDLLPNFIRKKMHSEPGGLFSSKLIQGFGPHGHDLYGPLSSRHLMEIGQKNSTRIPKIDLIEDEWNLRRP